MKMRISELTNSGPWAQYLLLLGKRNAVLAHHKLFLGMRV